MQAYNFDKMQYEMPDSEDHFLLEPQGDVTSGADKRQVQLVRVMCMYVCIYTFCVYCFGVWMCDFLPYRVHLGQISCTQNRKLIFERQLMLCAW
jgi:hypothetical protein